MAVLCRAALCCGVLWARRGGAGPCAVRSRRATVLAASVHTCLPSSLPSSPLISPQPSPLQNDLSELFMLLHFLEPQLFDNLGACHPLGAT